MKTENTIKLITSAKKLSDKITVVSRGVKSQYANIQLILASAIWRGVAHNDNDRATELVNAMPERLKGPIKTYLTEVGPFSWNSEKNFMGLKSGKHPEGPEAANKFCENLPNWETFKKPREEKAIKATSLIVSLAKKLSVAIENGNVDSNDVAQANALLSYMDNIKAGLTKEKMLADAQIAMRESIEQGYKARQQMDMAADASVQTQQVLADIAEKQAA